MATTWYQTNKALFLNEVENMEKEGFVLDKKHLKEHQEVAFEGYVEVDGERHRVRFAYENEFPFHRPEVYLPDKPISAKDEHRTLNGGNLCLMGYLPDEWDTELSGVALIENIKKWIRSDNTGKWENEHKAIDTMLFPTASPLTIVIPDELRGLPLKGRKAQAAMRFYNNTTIGILFNVDSQSNEANIDILKNKSHSEMILNVFPLTGSPMELFKLFSENNPASFNGFISKLIKHTEEYGESSKLGKDIHRDFLSRKANKEKFFIGITFTLHGIRLWHFFEVATGTKWTITPIKTEYLGDRMNRNRRVVDLEKLDKSSVAVIGIGAIGSSVAIELAMSGVGQLIFIDNDFLKIGNICRHEGYYEHIGQPKIMVMEKLVKGKNPFIKVVADPEKCHFDILKNRVLLAFVW